MDADSLYLETPGQQPEYRNWPGDGDGFPDLVGDHGSDRAIAKHSRRQQQDVAVTGEASSR